MPDNRKGFASALHIRGLRQRWMFSAVLPILLLLVLAVALFSVGVQEYYYNAMRSGLESRARIAAETFTGYGVKSYSEYYRLASYSAETFEEKDTIELQFINTNGRVQVSSYGLTAGTLPGTSDVDNAIGGKMASFQGRDPQTGENILAVSYPLFFNSRVVGVLRYVTSLREAQHRVLVESLLASAAALVCMALIAASNAIFINNVVQPVAVVSDAARRISGGSYGIMIENHYRDELGELVDNINDMSLKISQAEKIQQEFISSVSHELRTPLTAISGWAETLSADPGANIIFGAGIDDELGDAIRITVIATGFEGADQVADKKPENSVRQTIGSMKAQRSEQKEPEVWYERRTRKPEYSAPLPDGEEVTPHVTRKDLNKTEYNPKEKNNLDLPSFLRNRGE